MLTWKESKSYGPDIKCPNIDIICGRTSKPSPIPTRPPLSPITTISPVPTIPSLNVFSYKISTSPTSQIHSPTLYVFIC